MPRLKNAWRSDGMCCITDLRTTNHNDRLKIQKCKTRMNIHLRSERAGGRASAVARERKKKMQTITINIFIIIQLYGIPKMCCYARRGFVCVSQSVSLACLCILLRHHLLLLLLHFSLSLSLSLPLSSHLSFNDSLFLSLFHLITVIKTNKTKMIIATLDISSVL